MICHLFLLYMLNSISEQKNIEVNIQKCLINNNKIK